MLDVVRFWLKKGSDGFRLDITDVIFEDEKFRDNPGSLRLFPSEKSPDFLFQSTKYTQHHPKTLQFMKKLRSLIDEYDNPSRFMVGEVYGPMYMKKQYCGDFVNDRLNLVFLFNSMGTPLKALRFKKLIQLYEKFLPDEHFLFDKRQIVIGYENTVVS